MTRFYKRVSPIILILFLFCGCSGIGSETTATASPSPTFLFPSQATPLPDGYVLEDVVLMDEEKYPFYHFNEKTLGYGQTSFSLSITPRVTDKLVFTVKSSQPLQIFINNLSAAECEPSDTVKEYLASDQIVSSLRKGENTIRVDGGQPGEYELEMILYSRSYLIPESLRIVPGKSNAVVSSGLFGLNMEITRSTMWNGLSAQLLNNRKFYAGTVQNGPNGWNCEKFSYITNQKERSVCNSNYVMLQDGGSLSYSDESLTLVPGKKYLLQVWTNADVEETVKLTASIGGNIVETFTVVPGKEAYREFSESFVFPEGCVGGTFSLQAAGDSVEIYEVSLLPEDNYYGMRPDVVAAIADLQPTTLRFPGGCCADKFDWKEGLKDAAFRTPMNAEGMEDFLFTDTYHQDCYDIGINEFLRLCQVVGAEPEYTVSLVRGGAQDAHDIVEYCNGGSDTEWGAVRASFGIEAAGIRHWYVGNEIFFFGGELREDAEAASGITLEYINAMRSAAEDILFIVGACMSDPNYMKWSKDYLVALGDSYDYVSIHMYNGGDVESLSDYFAAGDFVENLLKSSTGLNTIAALLKNLPDQAWLSQRIYMDEWNLGFGLRASSVMLLGNALTMQYMARNAERLHLWDASYFHPVNEGMLTVTPTEVVFNSPGLLFQLFQEHKGGILLDTECEWEQLDILCTQQEEKIVLSIVNRDPRAVRLSLDAFYSGQTYQRANCITMEVGSLNGGNDQVSVYRTEISPEEESYTVDIPGHSVLFLTLEK